MIMLRYPGGAYQENWRMNRLLQLAFHYGPAQVWQLDEDEEEDGGDIDDVSVIGVAVAMKMILAL